MNNFRNNPQAKTTTRDTGVEIRECLSALSEAGDEAKSIGLQLFRASGGDLDRWNWSSRRAMCQALISVEDWLEVTRSRSLGRSGIRVVRRRLELELN